MKRLILGICVAVCAIVARADWTYDSSAATLTDENGWVMQVTSSEDRQDGTRALAIKKQTHPSGVTNLNLAASITWSGGTAKIVTLDREFAKGDTSLITVQLPDDLERIIYGAFWGCSNLSRVTPFLPDTVIEIGGNIFKDCNHLKGDLVLGGGGLDIVDFQDRDNPFYACWWIDSITFGTGTINMSANCFRGCGEVRTITFLGDRTTWKSGSFYDMGNSRYQCTVIVIPGAGNAHWDAWVTANVQPMSDTDLTQYYTERGSDAPTPIGKVNIFANSPQVPYQFVVRAQGEAQASNVTVAGSPVTPAGVAPDYGVTVCAEGTEFTAPAYGFFENKYYVCTGYTLTDEGGEPDVHLGVLSVMVQPDGLNKTLTWNWQQTGAEVLTKTVYQRFDTSIGTVAFSGEGHIIDNYYTLGSTVTLTATAASQDAPFVRWYGADVPTGHETENPLTVTVTGPIEAEPYFLSKWDYQNGYMSDGYWKFRASANGMDISTLSGYTYGRWAEMWEIGNLLDLDKPFVDPEMKLVAIGNNFLYYDTRFVHVLTLPNTLRTIGTEAFDHCRQLETVTPAFPESLERIGNAFNGCESLVIPCAQFGGVSTNEIDITELRLDDGPLTREVIFGCGVRRFGSKLFQGLNYLRTIRFMGDYPETFSSAFDGSYPTAYIKRIYVPRRNPTWEPFLAGLVPWEQVPPEGKNAYFGEYGADAPIPLGAGKLGNSKYQCVFLWKSPAEKPKGFVVILK